MVPGYYPDAPMLVRALGKLLGIGAESITGALDTLEDKRKGLPIDVPDPFFKGPF
jgi:hypothetical protein